MCDGKVINALEEITWSHTCFLCGIGGAKLNSITPEHAKCRSDEILRYGAQPLHLLIRSCEFVLHISYKIGLDGMSKEEKKLEEKRGAKLYHDQIYGAHGLDIDVPSIKFGRTTDGNMSRYYFFYHIKYIFQLKNISRISQTNI